MKIITLSLVAFSIFIALIVFASVIYQINLEAESIRDGTTDANPDYPNYAIDYYPLLRFNSILVAGPIILGIISLVFLVPNIILRIKKIPTRKYMFIIAAGILFFFGIPMMFDGLLSVLTLEQLAEEDWIVLVAGLIHIGYGAIFVIPGIIALKKAKLRN